MNFTELRKQKIPHHESSRQKRQWQAGIVTLASNASTRKPKHRLPDQPVLRSEPQTSLCYGASPDQPVLRSEPQTSSDFSGYALTVQLSSGFLIKSNPRISQSVRLCLPPPYFCLIFRLPIYRLPFSSTPSMSHPLIKGPLLCRAHTPSLILLEGLCYYLGPETCPSELQTALLGWHTRVLHAQSLSTVPTQAPFPTKPSTQQPLWSLRLKPIYGQVLDVLICAPVTLLGNR